MSFLDGAIGGGFFGSGRIEFGLTYQISPIILTGGIASDIPGGMLPIIALTQALSFPDGLLGGGGLVDLEHYMMQFQPLPGGTLIDQKIGEYPFANQSVAANAIIVEPLVVSYLMFIHTEANAGYQTKTATLTALQQALSQHNTSGGTYTCATPAMFYTDCVMTGMRDISRRDVNQPQNTYQLDFRQPLISLAAAAAAQNNLMSQISGGTPTDGSGTGLGPNTGTPPSPGPTASTVPAASGAGGAGVAGTGPSGPVQAAGG